MTERARIMFVCKITAFAGIHLILFCLLVPAEYADTNGLTFKENVLDFTSLEEEISTTAVVEPYPDSLPKDTCDCGPNSKGCTLENGTKICTCKYLYRPQNETCTAWCKESWHCRNGAECVNESCQCLSGTGGDFCDIIDDCEGIKGPIMCGDPEDVLCQYNPKTKKPYCSCRTIGYVYDPNDRTCKDCDCGAEGNCSLLNGKKTCQCKEGSGLQEVEVYGRYVGCRDCKCGNNSNGCSFDRYKKTCHCNKGYAQQIDYPEESCNECDCGPHGRCYFRGFYMHCDCDQGYSPSLNIKKNELLCKECDCGKNGRCQFEDEVHTSCKCNKGYALRDGVCVACQCYLGEETVECTFTNKTQNCHCPDGYEQSKFFCSDVDECLNSSACPPTTDCNNTMGSYECNCKEGYAVKKYWVDPKTYGCDDINECTETDVCIGKHTDCYNLPGNYSCECEWGYVPIPPNDSPEIAGCEMKPDPPRTSPWKIGTILVGFIFGVTFFLLLFIILGRCEFHRSTRSQSETPFVNIN